MGYNIHQILKDFNFFQITAHDYGIDWNGPLPNRDWGDIGTSNGIEVADVHLPLPEEACFECLNRIDVNRESGSFGIDIFNEAVDILTTLFQT